jgi:hypothetical protein
VVSWAGTREVVPLAAALSIPLNTTGGAPLPQRDLVLVLVAATIVISLIVQGFTLEPLARLAGFGPTGASPLHEETVARLRMAEADLARLDELAGSGAAPDEVIDRLRTSCRLASAPPAPAWSRAQGPTREPGSSRTCAATSSPPKAANCPGSTRPAPSAPPPAGGSNGTWTWKPPGSPKDTNKRTGTGTA